MKRQLLATILFLAATPLPAQTGDGVQTLVLPLSSEAPTFNLARVITSGGRIADCIAPVVVTRIDGEMRTVPAQGFLIEPGAHTFNGRATLDMTYCPLVDANPQVNPAEDLEIELRPGNTYYVGYDYKPANTQEWKLLVWRMEESTGADFQQD